MPDTRSKNFAKWFGNSKLVDENGKPMVLYHGTDRDFSSFDPRKHGESDHGWYGVGHYLTSDPEKANAYSAYRGEAEAMHGFAAHPGANVMPVHARLENPYIWPQDRPAATNMEEAIQITKKLMNMGYDGVIAPNYYDDGPHAAHDEVVVFRPHQIKSAIGNSGEYDPKDADITKAEGGPVEDDSITAYHGSPHDFDRFDISKIGTGEGAQSYGHGLYFAQAEPTAKTYRDALSGDPVAETGEKPDWQNKGSKSLALMSLAQSMDKKLTGDEAIRDAIEDLSRNAAYSERKDIKQRYYDAATSLKQMLGKDWKQNPGHMYEVHIDAHPDHFLDWDKPLQEQPYVLQKLIEAGALTPQGDLSFMYNESPRHGGEMYERLTSPMAEKLTGGKSQKHASDFLHGIGIKGIRYLDQGSRDTGEGSHNYVVFDDKLVNVKRKYAQGGMVSE